MTKIEYPKFLYHATEPARIVADASEHAAAGPEWAESPGEALVQGRSEADRRAHAPEAAGSIPVPAPIVKRGRPRKVAE